MIVNILSANCITCKKKRPIAMFYKNKANKSGYTGSCKSCIRSRVSKYNKENHEAHLERSFKSQLHKRYGITREEYVESMGTSSCCQICSKEEDLCYDHDHVTGKFRGVLCRNCNRAIGQLGDTAEGVKNAYDYLNDAYGQYMP